MLFLAVPQQLQWLAAMDITLMDKVHVLLANQTPTLAHFNLLWPPAYPDSYYHPVLALLAQPISQLAAAQPTEPTACQDSIYLPHSQLVPLAHLLPWHVPPPLSSNLASTCITLPQSPVIKSPVLLAQLPITSSTVSTPPMLPAANPSITQITEFALHAHSMPPHVKDSSLSLANQTIILPPIIPANNVDPEPTTVTTQPPLLIV